MNDKPENPQAFPVTTVHYDNNLNGMTLRDYFAAAALTGIISAGAGTTIDRDVRVSYKYADEMLKQREKSQSTESL
jgi:hypothetical protein